MTMREVGEPQVVLDGLGFPESTRWHDGRVWLCNWGAGEVLAVGADGGSETVARIAPQTIPFSIDWLPDGRLLVIDGPRRLLLRQEWRVVPWRRWPIWSPSKADRSTS